LQRWRKPGCGAISNRSGVTLTATDSALTHNQAIGGASGSPANGGNILSNSVVDRKWFQVYY
jgi:hypothetical protein